MLKNSSKNIFVPITVGGGIRSIDDASLLMSCDKVAINTAAVKDKQLINKLANEIGSQALVCSIEAKSKGNKIWEVYTDNGRETGIDVISWSKFVEEEGAGDTFNLNRQRWY